MRLISVKLKLKNMKIKLNKNIKKILLSVFIAFFVFSMVSSVMAQNINTGNDKTETESVSSLNDSIKMKREELNKEIEAKRAEIQNEKKSIQQKNEEMRKEIQNKREELNKEIQAKREEVRARISEITKNKFGEIIKNTTNRFSATIERLSTIADRIDASIAKFAAKGAKTDEAKQFLSEARLKLDEAKTNTEAIGNVSVGDNPTKTDLDALKVIVDKAKQSIKDAHTTLISAIRSLNNGKSWENSTTTDKTL